MRTVLLLGAVLLLVPPHAGVAQSLPDPRFGVDEGLSDAQTMADAGAYAPGDPPGYHYIGGEPTLVVEGPG